MNKDEEIVEYVSLLKDECENIKNDAQFLKKIEETCEFIKNSKECIKDMNNSSFQDLNNCLNNIFFRQFSERISHLRQSGKKLLMKKALVLENEFASHVEKMLKDYNNFSKKDGKTGIKKVTLLDSSGKESKIFKTNGFFSAKIDYTLSNNTKNAAFGIGIHTLDGIYVCGPNTENVKINYHKSGHVLFKIESLPLIRGRYFLSATITHKKGYPIFDKHWKKYPFVVFSGKSNDKYGLISVSCDWEFKN
jgi:hypothetical protein